MRCRRRSRTTAPTRNCRSSHHPSPRRSPSPTMSTTSCTNPAAAQGYPSSSRTSWPTARPRPPRPRTARRRCRGLCGRRNRTASQPNRWPTGDGIRLPATTVRVRPRCGEYRRHRPRPRGEQKERGERQSYRGDRDAEPQEEATHRHKQGDHVGHAHPQLLLALDDQAAVEGPLLHSLGDVGLGLIELLPGLDGLLRFELVARPVHPERQTDLAADGIQLLPLTLLDEAADPPILVVDLLQQNHLAFGEIEQRGSERVLGDDSRCGCTRSAPGRGPAAVRIAAGTPATAQPSCGTRGTRRARTRLSG